MLFFKQVYRWIRNVLLDWHYFWYLATVLLVGDLFLNLLIIRYIAYTEIDWIAYMQEVHGFLQGERDYLKLRGDTGPLVYPSGFLYLFSLLYKITDAGKQIRIAQHLFALFYSLNQLCVFFIYRNTKIVPPFILFMLVFSKRYHSIYVLRLFNDPLALFFVHASILVLQHRRFAWASLLFSLGLSIKMNVLLFLPALGVIYLKMLGAWDSLFQLALILILQLILAWPFLTTFPLSYFQRAFELNRVFMYKWTVNWKMIPEEIFLHAVWSFILLGSTLAFMLLFLHKRFLQRAGGLPGLTQKTFMQLCFKERAKKNKISAAEMTAIMFTVNFIGVLFSRTLHYQFYAWYFCSLPYLLAISRWPNTFVKDGWACWMIRFCLFATIEYCWNVYPATAWSSTLLLISHTLVLYGVWNGTARLVSGKSNNEKLK